MTPAEIVEHVRLRCYCDEESGCWHWKFFSQGGKRPTMQHPTSTAKVLVRRLLWATLHPAKVLKREDWIVISCTEPTCVAPAHLKKSTRSKQYKGRVHTPQSRRKRIANARAQSSLTWDDIQAIRASTESEAVLGTRYGKDRSLIGLIRRGKRWPDIRNPFAGLMR